jgi:hypothetical protein
MAALDQLIKTYGEERVLRLAGTDGVAVLEQLIKKCGA